MIACLNLPIHVSNLPSFIIAFGQDVHCAADPEYPTQYLWSFSACTWSFIGVWYCVATFTVSRLSGKLENPSAKQAKQAQLLQPIHLLEWITPLHHCVEPTHISSVSPENRSNPTMLEGTSWSDCTGQLSLLVFPE